MLKSDENVTVLVKFPVFKLIKKEEGSSMNFHIGRYQASLMSILP